MWFNCVSLANDLRKKSRSFDENIKWYNSAANSEKLYIRPSPAYPLICYGIPYDVIVEPGDVMVAHWIGLNITDEPRIAQYCRIWADKHLEKKCFTIWRWYW